MLPLLIISLIAGALTVLAPCILPLLPVIVGGSVAGKPSPRRALTIVLALGASVFAFTLLLKVSTAFINVPAIAWQLLSGGLLLIFGIVTLVPSLWDRIPFVNALYRKSNVVLGSGYQKQSVWGDIVVGAALGPVFSSCSPTYFVILAAVLPAHFSTGILYLLAYVVGLCAFLFVVAFAGQRAALWLGLATDTNGWFRKVIGVLFIIVGIAVIFGLDAKLEAALPASAFGEIGLEQDLLSTLSTTSLPQSATTSTAILTPAEEAQIYQKAPQLVSPDGYINTGGQPINLAQYLGKDVVLVDFWDYSCINCQREIPHLEALYQEYKGEGLVVIGVHTPEFSFEHLLSNVQAAVTSLGITYPVVLDNEYQTWDAYQNEYWPNEYLVDSDGYIVYQHSGEGDYDQTQQAVEQALDQLAVKLGTGPVSTTTVNVPTADLSDIQSPETYFGSNRNEYLGNGAQGQNGTQSFTLPDSPYANTLYLGGSWNIQPEYAEATVGATVLYEYDSDDVYMVATNPSGPTTVKVLMDGKPVGTFAGADVNPQTSVMTVNGDRLYKLISDPTPGVHTIELEVESGTLDAYTFTFG